MINLPDGVVQFTDLPEMHYFLFLQIGLAVNNDSRLYDVDSDIVLRFETKYIKSTVFPGDIYAGKDEIVFDPANCFKLMNMLFYYFIEKFANDPENGFDFVACYSDKIGEDKVQVTVQYNKFEKISSRPYYNMYLCLIELIFNIAGNFEVDLSNFDIPKEI